MSDWSGLSRRGFLRAGAIGVAGVAGGGEAGMNKKQAQHDAAVLPRIHELQAEGRSLRDIAAHLQQEGVPPPRRGGRWNHSAVGRILARADHSQPEESEHPAPPQDGVSSPVLLLGSLMLGAAIGVAFFVAAYVAAAIGPDELSMKRHLWNVATEAEREQIREILFRSYADPALICELTAPRRPFQSGDLPPPKITPPPARVEPPRPQPAHPFADTL